MTRDARWLVYGAMTVTLLSTGLAAADAPLAHYRIPGDGTVIDTRTRLVWERAPDGVSRRHVEALGYCDGLVLGGRSDWRLPTALELSSIIDVRRRNPAIDISAFPGTPADYHWTSTQAPGGPPRAFRVFFLDGQVIPEDTAMFSLTRCVHTGA